MPVSNIKQQILDVLTKSEDPLTASEITRALRHEGHMVSPQSVASHLGYMRQDKLVTCRKIGVGGEVMVGSFGYPERTVNLWCLYGHYRKQNWRKIMEAARHHRLPVAKLQLTPKPHTYDMLCMVENIQRNSQCL